MSNYVNSFFISLVLYASLFGFILYESQEDSFCDKKHKDVTRVSIAVINNQPVVEKEKITPEIKPKKKVQKKKEEIKKVEKVVKKETLPIPKPIQKKPVEVVKEEVAKVEEKEIKKVNTQKAINTKIQKTVNKDEIRAKQDIFLANLVKRINSNKFYPHSARRRAIQGEVEMKFCLLKSGHVKDIDLVSGKHIFKRSAIRAIEKSFPVDVDNTLFSFPKEFKITIAYILK
jgi:periplasmic protein TonB